jgi:hypothetical protein
MSDLRTRLERLGERARPVSDAFERLERVRRRRERNRQLAAGVVALLVAVAGSLAAFSALRTSDRDFADGGESEIFFALWPESTLEDAQATQDAVDAGEPALSWRLDPEETALALVRDALGWPEPPEELAHSSTTSPDGTVTVDVVKQPDPGTCQSPECAGRDVVVRLRQLVAEGGIWSVVSVESPVFNMPLHPGEEVDLGRELSIAAGWPDGTEVAVGFAGTGGCSFFNERTVAVRDLSVVERVAAAAAIPAGCTGYVYALTPSTPQGQIALGRIIFPSGGLDAKPDLAYTLVTSITAVPVQFVEATAAEPAEEARITCDGATPIARTPVVLTQPDGVHVVLSNPTDETLSFSIERAPADSYEASVSSLEPGSTQLVLTQPPGHVEFWCSSAPKEGQAGVAGIAGFEIVDPDGHYISPELECEGGSAYGSGSAYPAGTTGDRGTPIEVAEARLTGLEPDDVVEIAGYPDASLPVLRIVRDGRVVGRVKLADDGAGRWLLESVEGCAGTSFGWSETAVDESPYPRGAFAWCPEPPFLELGADWSTQASDAAVQFVLASSHGDASALAAVMDASVPQGSQLPVSFAGDAPVVMGSNGRGGDLVRFGCGSDVDAATAAITIDDGTDSASLDFTVFLVQRQDGWKVWAVY